MIWWIILLFGIISAAGLIVVMKNIKFYDDEEFDWMGGLVEWVLADAETNIPKKGFPTTVPLMVQPDDLIELVLRLNISHDVARLNARVAISRDKEGVTFFKLRSPKSLCCGAETHAKHRSDLTVGFCGECQKPVWRVNPLTGEQEWLGSNQIYTERPLRPVT